MYLTHIKTFCFGIVLALIGVHTVYLGHNLVDALSEWSYPLAYSLDLFGWVIAPAVFVVSLRLSTKRKWIQLPVAAVSWIVSWLLGLMNDLDTPLDQVETMLYILAALYAACALVLIVPSIKFRSRAAKMA
jgi:hypothetical protein